MVPNVQGTYNISRKEASQMLKVSVRTLDRYITKRIITSKNIAGRILLNEEEVLNFNKQNRPHKNIKAIRIQKTTVTQNANSYNQKEEIHDPDLVANVEERIYRKLYDELKEDVKLFQQRLEGANYRVGQLESELKASVPLQEHQKLLTGHKKEVFNKRVLYILLAGVLILQPLWIILAFL